MLALDMGELYAGPGYRRCARPGCSWPAVAVMGYDYAARRSWIEELGPRPDPATYELCALHSDRFSPPQGWDLQDRRGEAPAAHLRSVEATHLSGGLSGDVSGWTEESPAEIEDTAVTTPDREEVPSPETSSSEAQSRQEEAPLAEGRPARLFP
jgi:hypothetical protein